MDQEVQIQDDRLYNLNINKLSVRARGVLVRLGVNDLQSFLNLSVDQLYWTKNCGKKTTEEILRMQSLLRNHSSFAPHQVSEAKEKSELQAGTFSQGEHKFYQDVPQTSLSTLYNRQFENLKDDNSIDIKTIGLGLSVRAQKVLTLLNINDAKTLLDLPAKQLLKKKNCGRKTVKEILNLQETLRTHLGIQMPQLEEPVGEPELLIFSHSEEEKKFYEAVLESLSYRAANILKINSIYDLGQFMSLTKWQMLKWRNCGRKTANEIIDIQKNIETSMRTAIGNGDPLFNEVFLEKIFLISPLTNQQNFEDYGTVDPGSPYHSLYDWVSSFCKSERERRVFMLRKGMLGMPPMTLENLGRLLDLTRERVRQIESKVDRKASKNVQQHRLKPFIARTCHLVKESGGKLSKKELLNLLLVQGEDGDKLRYAVPFIDFLSSLDVWKEAALLLGKDGAIFIKETMTLVDTISPLIVHLARDNADEVIDEGLWSINCNLLKEHIVNWYNTYCGQASLTELSDSILNDSLMRVNTEIRRKKDRVYSLQLWKLRYGGHLVAAETVLQRSKSAMHFSQVYQEMSRFRSNRPGFSGRNVHATLDRSKNVFLWDRGTFIHKENVIIPFSLITEIDQWLETKLREDIPFVSAYGAFKAFESKCNEVGIPSETALYTCLKEAANPLFAYPHYPYVYLKEKYTGRLPIVMVIEQFLQEAGGPVSSKDLRDFIINGLCLKEFQMNQLIAQLSNVVRTSGGGFLHIDYFKIEDKFLNEIIPYTCESADREGHVSVKKIYNDKIINCKMAKIDSPEMLYSVFRLFAEDKLLLPNYPQIIPSTEDQERLGRQGIMKEFITYIKNKEGSCSYQELEDQFVNKLGYDERYISLIIYRCDIYRYLPSCLIHKDTIEWTDRKQNQLEQAATEFYSQAISAGRCYALITDLVESDILPALKEDIDWTIYLLADLLVSRGNFRVLGSNRNAFVASLNKFNIETFEDLIYYLLKYNYSGAANLTSFEKDIRTIGIIKKTLTVSMLGDLKKVCIVGREILLTELIADA